MRQTDLSNLLKDVVALDPETINFDDKDDVKRIIISQHNIIEILVKIPDFLN